MLKKRLFLALAVLLPLLGYAQAKSVPYFSQIGGASKIDADWTVYDVNADSKTWANDTYGGSGGYKDAGTTAGAKYSYNSSSAANDWLVSPAVHLEADKEYKISFYVKTAGSKESLRLVVANANTVEALSKNSETLLDFPELTEKKFKKETKVFTARETGDYYFGLYEYSAKDLFTVYVTAFQVAENVLTPGAVTDLAATEGADEALTVDLSWKLPTTDDDGNALTSALTGVEVYRDGALVKTLDGTATSWQDTEADGLKAGFHTYEVKAVLGTAKSAAASVTTKYVGPVAPQALPYTADLSSADKVDALFTQFKGASSTQTAKWKYKSSYYGNGNSMELATKTNLVEDEYLVTPPLVVAEAGAYKITLDFAVGYYGGEKLEVLMGKAKTAEGLNIPVKTLTTIKSSKDSYVMYVQLPEAGKYYLGLHACSEKVAYSGSTYKFYGLTVEKTSIVPEQITDLAAVPFDNMTNNVTLTWTNPEKTNINTDLTALTKVEVLRGGEVVKTFDAPQVGAAMNYVDAVPAPGYYDYQVVAYNDGGAAAGTAKTVRTGWVGDNTQSLPYEFKFNNKDRWGFYTVVDANNDGHTWTYNNGSYSSGSACNDHSKMTEYAVCNDYLVTPPFNTKAGYYRVIYSYNGKGASFKVGTVKDAKAPAASFKQFRDVEYVKDYGYTIDTCVVKIEDSGKMYFAFQDYSIASSSGTNKLYITDIKIEYTPVVPEVATELTGKAAADQSLSATLTWLNPTATNIEGIALDKITKAVILRDGLEAGVVTEGLVPGQTATWTDNTIQTPGQYKYTVEIYNENGKSEHLAPSVLIDWVGGGLALPYSVNVDESSDIWSNWKIVNANGDHRTIAGEEYETTWEASGSSIYYNSGKIQGDDWAMSPRLQFEDGTRVLVTLESYASQADADVVWDLALAPALDHTQMTAVKTLTTAATASTSNNAQTDYVEFNVTSVEAAPLADGNENTDTVVTVTPGVKVIGFHANNIGEIHVKSIKVEKKTVTGIVDVADAKRAMSVAGGVLTVEGASEVAVYDIVGRKVAESRNGEAINLNGQPAGVYVVTATVNGARISAKISK